jgi:SOS-response transcriptional repressor LexA
MGESLEIQSVELMHVAVLSNIGAARRFDDIALDGFRDVPKPKAARKTDQYCISPVAGDSLRDAGIRDGDEAVIRTTFDAHELTPGQLLAVWTPYGLLMKFVYWTLKGQVRLVSANPDYEDILLDADLVTVQGVVEYTMHYWR